MPKPRYAKAIHGSKKGTVAGDAALRRIEINSAALEQANTDLGDRVLAAPPLRERTEPVGHEHAAMPPDPHERIAPSRSPVTPRLPPKKQKTTKETKQTGTHHTIYIPRPHAAVWCP